MVEQQQHHQAAVSPNQEYHCGVEGVTFEQSYTLNSQPKKTYILNGY